MARNARPGLTAETIEEKASVATAEEVKVSAEASAPVDEVKASAPKAAIVEAPAPPPEQIPPTKTYRVMGDHWVILDGQRFMLRNGKVVDEANYNIDLLKSQSVKLDQL